MSQPITTTILDQELEQIKVVSMKEILDMCFSDDVFASTQKGLFKKDIPCLNKHKYKTEVVTILEIISMHYMYRELVRIYPSYATG